MVADVRCTCTLLPAALILCVPRQAQASHANRVYWGENMRNQSIKILLTAIAALGLTSWVAAEQSVVEPAPGESSGSRVMVFPSEGGAYLGVDVQDVTSDRLSQLKLKEERGAEIEMVDQDAPAGKAGLREHDVILSFNGEPVESVEQLHRMIRETPAGRSLALGISRDGQAM